MKFQEIKVKYKLISKNKGKMLQEKEEIEGDGPKLFAPPGRGSMSHPASTVCPLSGRADKVKTRKKKENTCGKNLNFILSSFNYVNHEF